MHERSQNLISAQRQQSVVSSQWQQSGVPSKCSSLEAAKCVGQVSGSSADSSQRRQQVLPKLCHLAWFALWWQGQEINSVSPHAALQDHHRLSFFSVGTRSTTWLSRTILNYLSCVQGAVRGSRSMGLTLWGNFRSELHEATEPVQSRGSQYS